MSLLRELAGTAAFAVRQGATFGSEVGFICIPYVRGGIVFFSFLDSLRSSHVLAQDSYLVTYLCASGDKEHCIKPESLGEAGA